ncbi:flavoprotein [Streptomyces flaveolus]|uniref:flavoprotein n=1 Tax=Streptomyces flaveolus TaxID=67297 RepID=UPI0033245928
MKTPAAVRTGHGEGLIGRSADVMHRERRRLVLVARETPLSAVRLENTLGLTRMVPSSCRPFPPERTPGRETTPQPTGEAQS